MSNILVVPDVHGRDFYKSILENTTDKIVFLGDYTDPYPYEKLESDDVISAMMDIFSFAKDNPDRVIVLLGNHDYPYFRKAEGYSRYNKWRAKQYEEIFDEFRDIFKIAYWDEETQTMFTHAGVVSKWWDSLKMPDMTPQQISDYFNNLALVDNVYDPLDEVGFSRGGWDRYGSCIWADVTEHLHLKKDECMLFKQIFGHSQLKDTGTIIHQNNWWMCDSRCIFKYDGENLEKYLEV